MASDVKSKKAVKKPAKQQHAYGDSAKNSRHPKDTNNALRKKEMKQDK